MRILGIETSADDTGVALIEANGPFGTGFKFEVLGNTVSSQSHAEYGGIYPNMAKREHAKNLVPTLERTLREGRILRAGAVSNVAHVKDLLAREPEIFEHLTPFLSKYERPDIDAIAVTVGPGLEPCLWTGINLARVLADVWDMPVVPVNHMEGHLLMSTINFGQNPDTSRFREVSGLGLHAFTLPTIVLLVSGGHTELLLMKALGDYQYIGRTRDDAAGEAFDKVARLLDLPYPGGPQISRLAEEARKRRLEPLVKLPRPMITTNDYDFSFSGLKTAVERFVSTHEWQSLDRERIAREVEDAITDVLVYKTLRAVEEYGVSSVVMSGGVSANKHIREELNRKLKAVSCQLLVCPPEYSTDNGLMIALAGYFHALNKEFADPSSLVADGNLMLDLETAPREE